jgi:hypothetical protein
MRILSPCANRDSGFLELPERIRFFFPSTTFGYISSIPSPGTNEIKELAADFQVVPLPALTSCSGWVK